MTNFEFLNSMVQFYSSDSCFEKAWSSYVQARIDKFSATIAAMLDPNNEDLIEKQDAFIIYNGNPIHCAKVVEAIATTSETVNTISGKDVSLDLVLQDIARQRAVLISQRNAIAATSAPDPVSAFGWLEKVSSSLSLNPEYSQYLFSALKTRPKASALATQIILDSQVDSSSGSDTLLESGNVPSSVAPIWAWCSGFSVQGAVNAFGAVARATTAFNTIVGKVLAFATYKVLDYVWDKVKNFYYTCFDPVDIALTASDDYDDYTVAGMYDYEVVTYSQILAARQSDPDAYSWYESLYDQLKVNKQWVTFVLPLITVSVCRDATILSDDVYPYPKGTRDLVFAYKKALVPPDWYTAIAGFFSLTNTPGLESDLYNKILSSSANKGLYVGEIAKGLERDALAGSNAAWKLIPWILATIAGEGPLIREIYNGSRSNYPSIAGTDRDFITSLFSIPGAIPSTVTGSTWVEYLQYTRSFSEAENTTTRRMFRDMLARAALKIMDSPDQLWVPYYRDYATSSRYEVRDLAALTAEVQKYMTGVLTKVVVSAIIWTGIKAYSAAVSWSLSLEAERTRRILNGTADATYLKETNRKLKLAALLTGGASTAPVGGFSLNNDVGNDTILRAVNKLFTD